MRHISDARVLTLKRIGGLLSYTPTLVHRTGKVHWSRVVPDYGKRLVLHTACGWAMPYSSATCQTTSDAISCKRCAQYDGATDG